MEKLQRYWKVVFLAVLVVLLGILGVVIFRQYNPSIQIPTLSDITTGNNNVAAQPTSTMATTTTASKPTTTSPGVVLSSTGNASLTQTSSSIPVVPRHTITITLLTPISNNQWTIGQPNPIAWDNPANITGEIDLVDAKTKSFIGVILSETGSNQTSYIWDARSIYLERYSPNKKDVVPGVYSIRIHFDGNGLSDLVSGPITISK